MIKNKKIGIIEMVKFIKTKLNEDIFTFKKKEANHKYYSYILNSKSSIINDNNNNCNNTSINEIYKSKGYLLNYYTEQSLYISEILNLFYLNLERNPKYYSLNCQYQIFPLKGVNLKPIISKCKEITVIKEVSKTKNEKESNSLESDFDLQKNQIEAILLIESNILNEEKERKKIFITLEALYNSAIKFLICIFGENELDSQKLNELSWNKFYANENNGLFKVLFLNKSIYENFHPFCFYSKQKFFKMIRLNKDLIITEIYNIDMFDSIFFSLSSIKNRNIFNFLLFISKKDNIDTNENNIPNNDDNDYERFKSNKKKIYEVFNENEVLNKTNSNTILSEVNICFSYNKLYIFPEENNDYNLIKKYYNIYINLTYLDYIPSQNFEEIKNIINDNNKNSSGKLSSIFIKLKEEKIKTKKLLENIGTVFECPKCNRSYTFDQNSFYFCSKCKNNNFFCEECYIGSINTVKIKKKKKAKNQDNNDFHEHPLILFYKYDQNKSSDIIEEKYNKYMEIIENNKKRICKV